MVIDTIQCKMFVTEKRVNKVKESIGNIAKINTCVKVKMLAAVAGQMISMAMAIGPVCRLMTRSIYTCIESRRSWWGLVFIDEKVLTELLFWLNNIDRLNGKPFIDNYQFQEIMYADASSTGYGY